MVGMRSTASDAKLQQESLPAEFAQNNGFETDVVTIPVKLCNLPPFSAIASRALAMTTDSDVDLRQFSDLIGGDPAFTADVLFLANSSLFGFPSRMHSIRHAVALLGFDRIKSLAVTVAMRSFLGKPNSLVHKCWQHSLACAVVCEEIAGLFDLPPDCAYTAGIMHDIGRLGFLKTYPAESAKVLSEQHLNTQAVLQAEREALAVDHACAGSWLIGHWGLPKDFSDVCKHHHDSPNTGDSAILLLVRAACRIADAIGFPAVRCQEPPSYLDAMSALPVKLRRQTKFSAEDMERHVTARLAGFES
jgi:HD-like signal output (HDOD) protein